MNVNDLVTKLLSLQSQGFGDSIVRIPDPDVGRFMPITGFTYAGPTKMIDFYSDED